MMTRGEKPEVRWAALRDDKLAWAYRAYRRFVEGLSEDVRAHLMDGAGDQEPYVVVFGKTQVGKTTLLLDLMGLGADAQARVSRVLRGGRAFGKSATATTMEYRRSPDGDWHLDDGSGMRRIAADDDMCEALGELRQRMSKRRLKVEKPVVVWIPDDCFGQTAGTGIGIGTRMLDLPGDNPADEVEREHVERMAQRYVPHADLILLVGRGDDLSFLNPEALTLPSIEDWQYVPNRFRIVTTYSFTPHTVQQFARNHKGKLTAEHFRERLLEQIQTFGLPLSPEAASTARFFPLEFGQSWQTMLQEDAAFAKRVEPLVNELKAALHADIQASATEAARFRNALDVQVVTRHKRKARIEQGKAALAELAERIAKAEATEQQALCGERRIARQAKAARALLSRRAAAEQELSTDLVFDAEDHITKVDGLTTNTSALFGRITDVTSWLRQRFLDTVPSGSEARKFFGNSRPNLTANIGKVKRITDDEFATLIARMEGYSLDEYYPKWSNCFSEDKKRLKDDIRDASVKTAELLQTVWHKHAGKRAAELEVEAAAAESEGLGLKQIAAQQKKAREKLIARSSEVEADMTRALARLDSDEGSAARFSNMLDEEYLTELREKHARVAMAKQPVDALLTLLSVADLSEERRKIKLS
ncbi:cell envelope integrity protein TolA [Massilia sp. Root335]|uniref:cell envelope integrity protein TolA n=1 Tax=Massilia sp. Root335 TaxID=1736517 RepID=UPI0006F2885B|nr:cell envelope integrity protein TolA [Massilia sp. Root335]KQV46386.1 hypothetical protein ASC93_14760 [Massilia sp. Root335]